MATSRKQTNKKKNDPVTLSVLIPVFNESEEALENTVTGVQKALEGLQPDPEIILIDDGSGETCRQAIDRVCQHYQPLTLLRNPYNLGYSASLKRGILKAEGQYILTIDADGSYPTDRIPDLVASCQDYAMVIGARTGDIIEEPFLRSWVKNIIRWLAMFLTAKDIPDLNSGLRVFEKSIALKFFHLLPSRFSFSMTLTLACLTNDFPIRFVPIDYHKRIGSSNIKPVQDTIQFFFLIFRIIMYFRPLRFFTVPALFLLITGLAYLAWGIAAKNDILDGAIMLIVVGFQILFTGLLADIITRQKLKE